MPVKKCQKSSGIAAASRNEQQNRRFNEEADDDAEENQQQQEEEEEHQDETWYLEGSGDCGDDPAGDIHMTSSSNCSSRIRGSSTTSESKGGQSTFDRDSSSSHQEILKKRKHSMMETPKTSSARGAGEPGNKTQFQIQNKIAELMKKIPVCDQDSKVVRLLLASK